MGLGYEGAHDTVPGVVTVGISEQNQHGFYQRWATFMDATSWTALTPSGDVSGGRRRSSMTPGKSTYSQSRSTCTAAAQGGVQPAPWPNGLKDIAPVRFDHQAWYLSSLRVTTDATKLWHLEGAAPWRGSQVLTTPAAEKI
jgi:hypothetical protein